jgi:hypothetical protein
LSENGINYLFFNFHNEIEAEVNKDQQQQEKKHKPRVQVVDKNEINFIGICVYFVRCNNSELETSNIAQVFFYFSIILISQKFQDYNNFK